MEGFISEEMETFEMKERIHAIREDLNGDVLESARLVKAARENNFEKVEALLESGADPRICRFGDAFGIESTLYYALKAKRFDIAEKLYKAGDRLDDLIVEYEEQLSSDILEFLSFSMREGCNYFYDDSKTLSECCRCSAFKQIEKLMPTAGKEELSKAFVNTVHSWIRYYKRLDIYSKILEDLLACGAKISEDARIELLESLDRRFRKCPKVMRCSDEALNKILDLIRKA